MAPPTSRSTSAWGPSSPSSGADAPSPPPRIEGPPPGAGFPVGPSSVPALPGQTCDPEAQGPTRVPQGSSRQGRGERCVRFPRYLKIFRAIPQSRLQVVSGGGPPVALTAALTGSLGRPKGEFFHLRGGYSVESSDERCCPPKLSDEAKTSQRRGGGIGRDPRAPSPALHAGHSGRKKGEGKPLNPQLLRKATKDNLCASRVIPFHFVSNRGGGLVVTDNPTAAEPSEDGGAPWARSPSCI